MRQKIIAGNWKMNTDLARAGELTTKVITSINPMVSKVIFFPPYPFLHTVQEAVHAKQEFATGAQNLSNHEKGAFTGEVSAAMLASVGCQYVLIGHSERRQYFNENSDILFAKIQQALKHSLRVIFCCGEPLEIREGGDHIAYVERQIKEVILMLDPEEVTFISIAYEPIWAIGTGKTATTDEAQEIHHAIRKQLEAHFSDNIARRISILYGGSVTTSNAEGLFNQPDIDGALIGGASLHAEEFVQIISFMESVQA
ncbi:MAG TPA: triose-phosphate isomerase [Saprospiraceae bacterium]|nr:triose-phosphate isomerase [Saprospiraceae bacterium]